MGYNSYLLQSLMETTIEKIYRSSLKFLEPLKIDETYAIITEEALRLVGAHYGSIYLGVDGQLSRVYISSRELSKLTIRKRANTYRCFTERRAILADISDTGSAHPAMREMGIESTIFIPLFYRDVSFGVLTVHTKKKEHFTKDDLDILKLFGAMATLAIRKTQLYDETKQALDTRDLFISLASHELRTPLTTISGYIQLLHSRLAGKATPESRWIEDLSYESLRLTKLVQELLAINQIKSGQLQYIFKEYRVSDIVKRAVKDLKIAYPEYKIILNDETHRGSDIIVCDFDKLLQVLINIVNNAVKFSPAKKEIEVGVKSKSPCIIVSVKDHGKGISKQDLPKIFEGFYKGKNHYKGGMGVGLYLAKDIIDRHHGLIKVKSRLNQGTTVEISLPRAEI